MPAFDSCLQKYAIMRYFYTTVLNTKHTITRGTLSIQQAYIQNQSYSLVRYGNTVFFSWRFMYTNPTAITGTVLATIPDGFKPVDETTITNFIESVDVVNTIFITPSGLLQGYINAGAQNWNARISLAWITN